MDPEPMDPVPPWRKWKRIARERGALPATGGRAAGGLLGTSHDGLFGVVQNNAKALFSLFLHLDHKPARESGGEGGESA